jgi:uncharacterized protein YdhG (YjbR/CyaY superfamily)
MNPDKPTTIDEYISAFPIETQELLEQVRGTIRCAAPEAVECISYGMPAFKFHGILVYFAGYKNHIGFYPTGSGIAAFQKEISGYKNSRGTVQFPLNKPLPLDLITQMVLFRVNENLLKINTKKK